MAYIVLIGLVLFVVLVIGAIVLAMVFAVSAKSPPPRGLRSAKCPRCNTPQNIPTGTTYFTCCTCHTVSPAPPL
jgi:hypothetical protein